MFQSIFSFIKHHVLLFVVLSIGLILIGFFHEILKPFVIAIIVAYIIDPLVKRMNKLKIRNHHIPRGVAVIVAYLLIERSRWGISVYMVGGNEKATRFSGINTRKTIMGVYVFSAVLSGLAGILMTSRYNSAKADYGSSYTMQAVAATVLGGTSINGGSGHVMGTVIAVCIIQVISSGFNILKINRNLTDIATGLILVGVLAMNHFVNQRSLKKVTAGVK